MSELADKFDAVSNSFIDIYKMLDGDDAQIEFAIHGLNELGYLRTSIKCMEKSQMQDTEAAINALEELKGVEFCGLLLQYTKQLPKKQVTLMLNHCEALRLLITERM